MLPIILMILKIIGVALLIILGVLLFCILAVLFVPIRYRVMVVHGDEFDLKGIASWFLHVIHAGVWQQNSKTHLRLRIFGIIIYDSLNKKTKKTKVKKKSFIRRKLRSRKAGKNKKTENDVASELLKIEKTESDEIKTTETITGETKSVEIKSDKVSDTVKTKTHPSLMQRFFHKVRSIKEKVIEFFKGLLSKIKLWAESASNLKRKIGLILDFIKDEINQEAFKLTFASLIKLLKHILPTKLKSKIIFGTGDPCSTGQALGVFGILYSIYGDKLQIIPDFENRRLEGKHYARGRIRLITLLIIVVKLILDKRFKYLRKNMKLLKEAL